jgi:hypothetical protein
MTYALAAVFPEKKGFLSLSFVQLKLHIITDDTCLIITKKPLDPQLLEEVGDLVAYVTEKAAT